MQVQVSNICARRSRDSFVSRGRVRHTGKVGEMYVIRLSSLYEITIRPFMPSIKSQSEGKDTFYTS